MCCCVKSNFKAGRGLLFTNIMQNNLPVFSDDKGKGTETKMTLWYLKGQITESNAVSSVLLCFETCPPFCGLSLFWSRHLTRLIYAPRSSFYSCPLLAWFTGCFCFCVSLRSEHSFLSGWWELLKAPSRRFPPWSQQDVRRQSGYSEPKCLLLRGPCHLTARSQWSWQDHHHVCAAHYCFCFVFLAVSACPKMNTHAFRPFIDCMWCLLNLICASL